MRTWWSRIGYKGDRFDKIKWHPQDRAYYLYARYTWVPEKNAYQVENLYKRKIIVDTTVPDVLSACLK